MDAKISSERLTSLGNLGDVIGRGDARNFVRNFRGIFSNMLKLARVDASRVPCIYTLGIARRNDERCRAFA
jgi:hypothetical protein